MEEETAYKWTVEKMRELVRLRSINDGRFTKKRNAAKQAWEFLIKEMGLEGEVTPRQASKKWENLKKKYKELRKPKTGSGTDRGEETASTWPYYADMHEALGSRPSISPPVLVSSCVSEITILPPVNVGDPAPSTHSPCPSPVTISPPSPMAPTSGPSPSPSPAPSPAPSPSPSPAPSAAPTSNTPQKRKRKSDTITALLFQEAEKEERRHAELTAQNERFLAAFEKMVDKM